MEPQGMLETREWEWELADEELDRTSPQLGPQSCSSSSSTSRCASCREA